MTTNYVNAVETAAWIQRTLIERTEERDAAIYSAHHSGGRSIREIARRVGISHTQVKNIVDRLAAEGAVVGTDQADDPTPAEARRMAKLSAQIDAFMR